MLYLEGIDNTIPKDNMWNHTHAHGCNNTLKNKKGECWLIEHLKNKNLLKLNMKVDAKLNKGN